jgi:hypothetical protein
VVGDQPISTNHPVTMLWETGHAIKDPLTNGYCNYENTECYESKTVPVIYDMSSREGWLTGGQTVNVTGYGFDYGTIDATLDGEPCLVTGQGKEWFTCTAAPKEAVSETGVDVVGQHGLSWREFDMDNWSDAYHWRNFDNDEEPI